MIAKYGVTTAGIYCLLYWFWSLNGKVWNGFIGETLGVGLSLLNPIRKAGALLIWINKACWTMAPDPVRHSRFGLFWGRWIFRLVEIRGGRNQLTTTYFFRNRAEIQHWLRTVEGMMPLAELSITIVGCSEGAEVYTIIYSLKKRFPGIRLKVHAFDINDTALAIAREGRYPSDSRLLSKTTPEELSGLFDNEGDHFRVKAQYREGIQWEHQDPTREAVLSTLPKQDFVIANRLLFHMYLNEQRQALMAIASMVRPGGYLFVSGVDLDVRSKLAKEHGWRPLPELLEEIHAGDDSMTVDWPFKYWGLEPLDKTRPDWQLRYCVAFRIP